MSTPRTELQGLLILCRVITSVVPGLMDAPGQISLMGNLECTSAVECEVRVLDTWFGNRVAEIRVQIAEWQRNEILVDKLHHWPWLSNAADLATKGRAVLEGVMSGSDWQDGPEKLSLPRECWPAIII